MKDRRICILTSMGWGVRNILMSRALESLHAACHVRVLSPFNHVYEFRKRFAHLDGLDELAEIEMRGFLRALYNWNVTSFYKISPSATHQYLVRRDPAKVRQKGSPPAGEAAAKAHAKKKPPADGIKKYFSPARIKGRLHRIADEGLQRLAQRYGSPRMYRMAHRSLRAAYRFSKPYAKYKAYFRKHGIDTLITSNPFVYPESPALLAAKDLGLRTVAVITSWDNLTSKRPLIIDFDDYVVWNPIMAGEIQLFYKTPTSRIHQAGPVQYDFYFDPQYADTRQEFCRQHGFDPARKILVYSGVTRGILLDEPRIVEKLLLARKEGRLHGSPNILFRTHPKRPLSDYRGVMEDPRWAGLPVSWTEAGKAVRAKFDAWCPLDDEIRLLVNTVLHGDVDINCFSTMLLDFAVLDKPSVLVCHDGQDRKLPYEIYHHLQPVLACKGHRVSYTFEETLKYANQYLDDPRLDQAGRQELVKIQCAETGGEGWQKLTDMILKSK